VAMEGAVTRSTLRAGRRTCHQFAVGEIAAICVAATR
jgi:hypothetical protein